MELHTNPWDFENDQIVSYLPLFNHCILFETNEHSWHGFQRLQMPDGGEISRKSFTIYMYTKERAANEIAPKHGTIYVQPDPPKRFQAGYTLTADDVQELKIALVRRNGFVQGMYKRESQLLTQIDNLTKAVEHLKKRRNPSRKRPDSNIEDTRQRHPNKSAQSRLVSQQRFCKARSFHVGNYRCFERR